MRTTASISAHGNNSSTHKTALVTSAPPSEQHQANPGLLYQPATVHTSSPPLSRRRILYQRSGRSPTTSPRTTLVETSLDTDHSETSASRTDNIDPFKGYNISEDKLAERRDQQIHTAGDSQLVEHHPGGHQYLRSSSEHETTQKNSTGRTMPVPYSEYRSRFREKQRTAAPVGPWDEEMEAAFMDAITTIPLLGRRKLPVDGQLRGRNQLIADHIYKMTGKRRNRKQVSSHIQVLKKLLKHDPEFMRRVSPAKPEYQEDDRWDPVDAGSPSAYSEPSPCMGTRPLPPSLNRAHSTASFHDYHSSFVTPPPTAHQASFDMRFPELKITGFDMRATVQNHAGELERFVHTFTTLAHEESRQQRPVPLQSMPQWGLKFPLLAELLQNNQLGANCSLTHISASMSLLENTLGGNNLVWSQLEASRAAPNTYNKCRYECTTRIYVPGKKVLEDQCEPVHCTDDPSASHRLHLSFAPKFWTAFCDSSRRSEEEARAAMSSLTAVQELFCTDTVLGTKERTALLLWEFSKADYSQPGKAIWRTLISPVASSAPMSAIIPHSIPTPVTAKVPVDCVDHLYTQPTYPMSPYLSPTLPSSQPYYYAHSASPPTTSVPVPTVNGVTGHPGYAGIQGDLNTGYYHQPVSPSGSFKYEEGHARGHQRDVGVGGYMAHSHQQAYNDSKAGWPQHLSPVSEPQSLGEM